MAKLAESIVEEWLNRQGFFTIRGVKHGNNEMDVLAVRPESNGIVTGWHVEVQVSFRPVGYLCPPSNAKKRTPQELAQYAGEWVSKKFHADGKLEMRKHLWRTVDWTFHLVHGVVREPLELDLIRGHGVALHTFGEVLESLCAEGAKHFTGSSGGDLAEIVDYYERTKRRA